MARTQATTEQIKGVNLASGSDDITGTLPVANGGTGAVTLTGILKGNGTSAVTTMTAPSGTVVGDTDTQVLTNKRVTGRVSTTASSAAPTINTDNVDVFGLTALTVDVTSFTTNLSGTPTDNQKLWIYIVGTATRVIAWGASFEDGAALLPLTTVGTTRLDVALVWNPITSKWRCMATSGALIDLASQATGTLAVANGGTGAVTLTGILKGSGTSAFSAATAGTDYVAPGGALGTPSSGTLSNCTGLPVSGVTASTATALGVGSIELGHASDTTVSRSSAGVIAVEGVIVPTETSTNTLTNKTLTNPTINSYVEGVVAIGNTSTAKTIDLTSGTVQTATLTGNCTFTMPTATAGKSFTLLLKTGAGSFTGTFTGVKWSGGTAPTITTAANKMDILSFFADGTNWYGSFVQNFTP